MVLVVAILSLPWVKDFSVFHYLPGESAEGGREHDQDTWPELAKGRFHPTSPGMHRLGGAGQEALGQAGHWPADGECIISLTQVLFLPLLLLSPFSLLLLILWHYFILIIKLFLSQPMGFPVFPRFPSPSHCKPHHNLYFCSWQPCRGEKASEHLWKYPFAAATLGASSSLLTPPPSAQLLSPSESSSQAVWQGGHNMQVWIYAVPVLKEIKDSKLREILLISRCCSDSTKTRP